MAVFLGITTLIKSPRMAIPRDKGVTSTSTIRSTNKDHIIYLSFLHLSIIKTLLSNLHALHKQVPVEFFKPCTKCPFRLLTFISQPPQCPGIPSNVNSVLSFELLYQVTHHSVIKIFPSEMGVSSSGLNFKDFIFNCDQRHIKGATTKIKYENIALSGTFISLLKSICKSCSCWFVDDSNDIKAGNDTGIFGGFSLRVERQKAMIFFMFSFV
ncbi:hypothetical protein Ahy_A04g017168 [Arachis hypogaea]|uniref:Uncharacterized protein n=1 Tax=Arachis hypogaea TaxID=3818 RepID=A0A445DA64_ARAHY|nr:hypothetical protein Ahy_A04g017168 [Arachis hypogaea]